MNTTPRVKKRVAYAEANYAALIRKNGYLVDKTEYIAKLEWVNNPIFLRPRRFGKSLLRSMLGYYYDLNEAENSEELFGQTWIGQNPTGQQNQYMILAFDFSTLDVGTSVDEVENSFKKQCNDLLMGLRTQYASHLENLPELDRTGPVADNLKLIINAIKANNLPPLYVTIDEYDNFSNQLITGYMDQLFYELMADDSSLKTFFKTLKEGRKTGAIANVFITGVLPITLDELASAFNVGAYLTLRPDFDAMLGFTQTEVAQLLDEFYLDHEIDPGTRNEVNTVIKEQYNGYHFIAPGGQALYNSSILMYFLDEFLAYDGIPEFLTDMNLRTDISWVNRLTGGGPGKGVDNTTAFVEQLLNENQISYDRTMLTTKFNLRQFFKPSFYPLSFFYLGMLTRRDHFYMQLPNLNMRQIFAEYFNELHEIDTATRYGEMMQRFVDAPNLEELFDGYWQEYVSQLPEAVFSKMNENFYRTTFYQLCSRYLSPWFTWNVERSYPSGKSDLEFVGKYHEKFANLRWVIEFKYLSNTKFKKLETTIEAFKLDEDDTDQIVGYATDLLKEYPEAQVEQFVIYCFGNIGYRVFPVPSVFPSSKS
ncbi:MAG: AAA family ATPase [Chloroflexota bacterium]